MQEMNEMKNLVIQALEARGSLSQLRAQVRASVFAAIEDQASQSLGKKNAFHWENSLCQELHKTQTGLAAIELIHEFMEYYRMDYTMNVFSSEANYKKGASTRESLIKQLKIDSQDKKPLLLLMLEQLSGASQGSQPKEDSSPSVQAAPAVTVPNLLKRAADHMQRLPDPKIETTDSAKQGGLSAQLVNQPEPETDKSAVPPVHVASTPSLHKESARSDKSANPPVKESLNEQAAKLQAQADARDKLANTRAPPSGVMPPSHGEEEEEFPEAIEEQEEMDPNGAEEPDAGVVLGASDDMYISESYGYNCSVTSEAMQQFDHIEEVEPNDDDEEPEQPEH